jgi:hypothetical protein
MHSDKMLPRLSWTRSMVDLQGKQTRASQSKFNSCLSVHCCKVRMQKQQLPMRGLNRPMASQRASLLRREIGCCLSPGTSHPGVLDARVKVIQRRVTYMSTVRFAYFSAAVASLLASGTLLNSCGNQAATTPPAAQQTTQPAAPTTPAPPAVSTAAPAAATTAVATATPSADATPTATVSPKAAALGSGDCDVSGVRADVTELKRTSGNILKLKFAIVNNSDKGYDGNSMYGDDKYRTVGGVYFLDEAGKKKYFVVKDSDGTTLCSHDVGEIAAKSQTILWAQFPAPPADVLKVTVTIPHFEPISDVPISQ